MSKQKSFSRIIILTILVLTLLQPKPVLAATRYVHNTKDSGSGSLRAVIANAGAGDTILFDAALAGKTITLLSTLVINKNLTIDGSSLKPSIAISGNGKVNVLQIKPNVTANLKSLRITKGFENGSTGGGGIYNQGKLTLTNCRVAGNSSEGNGGGIASASNTILTIIKSTIIGNVSGYDGGGIYTLGKSLTISGSTISDNTSQNYGGGIIAFDGPITISSSTIANNQARNRGGAIFSEMELTISKSKIINNSASSGGGIVTPSIDLAVTITTSTISSNSATTYGGGIYNTTKKLTIRNSLFANNSAQRGGGIYNFDTITISNSTFSGNTARELGGGILNYIYGEITSINNTFSENSAKYFGGGMYLSDGSTLHLTNTILANSTSGKDCYKLWGAKVPTNVNSFIETNGTGNSACGTPKLTGDPKLGPLASNGGATQTHALLSGSKAIDTGNDQFCPPTDQRGVKRPQGIHCDIGSFEFK